MSTNQVTYKAEPIKGQQIGLRITEDLSILLRRYTDKNHRADAAEMTGVSSSTVRDLVFRNNSLTLDNSKAIIALIEIAIKRCPTISRDANRALVEFKSYIRKI